MNPFMIIGSISIGALLGMFCAEGTSNFIDICCSRIIGSVEGLFYGRGMGIVAKIKKAFYVKTSIGKIQLPVFELPNLETDVGFILADDDGVLGENGLYSDEILFVLKTRPLMIYRNSVVVDCIYAKNDIWVYVNNIFEGECYIHHVREGDMIDYRNILNSYEKQIEAQ